MDESLTPSRLRSSLLRSEIHFGAPLPSFFSLQDRLDEQKRRFRSFVVQYADVLARQSTRLAPSRVAAILETVTGGFALRAPGLPGWYF